MVKKKSTKKRTSTHKKQSMLSYYKKRKVSPTIIKKNKKNTKKNFKLNVVEKKKKHLTVEQKRQKAQDLLNKLCVERYCWHEACHHFRVIKELKDQNYEDGLLFFASLLPYHDIHQKEYRGIINKIPDFFIAECFDNGKDRFGGLYIELKSPKGKVDPGQRKLLRKLINKKEYFVSVCHGSIEAIALINLYRRKDPKTKLNKATLEELEKAAWEGDTKKKWILERKIKK